LEANGFNVGRQFGIGSRETYVPAVRDHSIDLVPEYTGNLLQYFDPKTTVTTPDAVELALARALPGDLSILTPSPANDTDTVAVTEATARKWNLKTIGDLAAHSAEVKFGAPSSSRPAPRTARAEGQVRVGHQTGQFRVDQRRRPGDGAGTDRRNRHRGRHLQHLPAIPQNKLVVLEDPKNNFLAANVVPLVSSQKKSDELKTILDAVSAKLTTRA
jgi:osmoprotectant transport system substrate-binding protein